jgi:hypothetical protein
MRSMSDAGSGSSFFLGWDFVRCVSLIANNASNFSVRAAEAFAFRLGSQRPQPFYKATNCAHPPLTATACFLLVCPYFYWGPNVDGVILSTVWMEGEL